LLFSGSIFLNVKLLCSGAVIPVAGGQPIINIALVSELEQAPIPENLWKLGKLNHVAIAVPDLQKSMSLYRNILGAKVSEPEVR
jgi:hypothetical protein